MVSLHFSKVMSWILWDRNRERTFCPYLLYMAIYVYDYGLQNYIAERGSLRKNKTELHNLVVGWLKHRQNTVPKTMYEGRRVDISNPAYLASSSSILSTIPESFVKLPINNQSTDQSYFLTYDHPKENRKSGGCSKSLGNYTFVDWVW